MNYSVHENGRTIANFTYAKDAVGFLATVESDAKGINILNKTPKTKEDLAKEMSEYIGWKL